MQLFPLLFIHLNDSYGSSSKGVHHRFLEPSTYQRQTDRETDRQRGREKRERWVNWKIKFDCKHMVFIQTIDEIHKYP